MSNDLLSQPVEHVDILTFLLAKYRTAMEARNRELAAKHEGKQGAAPELDVEGELMRCRTFCNFGRNFLSRDRPAQLGHAEANYAIQLANGERFVIAPPIAAQSGSLQPTTFQQITGTRDAHEVPITGYPVPRAGEEDQPAKVGEARDMTKAHGPVDMTQPGAKTQ